MLLLDTIQRWVRAGYLPKVWDVFDVAAKNKFTGPLTFHCVDGVPRRFEAGRPLQIDLENPITTITKVVVDRVASGAYPAAAQIPLDKSKPIHAD